MEGEPPEAMLQQSQEFERERTVLEETLSRMGEEVLKLERTSMRVDMAGKTVRYLAGILDHAQVTPDHLKDCLPKFINYVTWRKETRADQGRFEVALFERPFRADRGRLLREVVEDFAGGPGECEGNGPETHKPHGNGAVCSPSSAGCAAEDGKGSLAIPDLHRHTPLGPNQLAWNPDLEEADDRPPAMILIDNYFAVYRNRRRALISGDAPQGADGSRPMHGRQWRAYQNVMNAEPAWERAERYRRMMQEEGYRSVRALARATGEDHSRLARVLKVLELPEGVLAALRRHAGNGRVRAHFTEKRLRQMVAKKRSQTAILCEIERVIGTGG